MSMTASEFGRRCCWRRNTLPSAHVKLRHPKLQKRRYRWQNFAGFNRRHSHSSDSTALNVSEYRRLVFKHHVHLVWRDDLETLVYQKVSVLTPAAVPKRHTEAF